MHILNLTCAALLGLTMSTLANAQMLNFPWTKRHQSLQRDALHVQMRKLQESQGTRAPSPAPTEGSTVGSTSEPTIGLTSEPTDEPTEGLS
jgi:hypothetical protein